MSSKARFLFVIVASVMAAVLTVLIYESVANASESHKPVDEIIHWTNAETGKTCRTLVTGEGDEAFGIPLGCE